MPWTLFLDDTRFPADVRHNYGPYRNVRICRSMDDAIWCVEQYGLPTFISFDHDLVDQHYVSGEGENTGYAFAKWFCNHVSENNLLLPVGFGVFVHSKNPVGAENIRKYMEDFLNNTL
jgi:hypothetical protein